MKILILEDSKAINNQLKIELSKQIEGIEIYQAFTIKEAFEILSNNKFDLILSDLNLPDGDGDEIVNEYGRDNKIIILTSDGDFQRRTHLFSQGVIDYYLKNMPIEYTVAKIIDKYNQTLKNKTYNILNVDDSSFSRNLIQKILKKNGFNVVSKKSAENVLEDITDNQIDLVVLDIEMPNINGLEAIKMIRKKDLYIPIIAISGNYSSQNEIIKIMKNGANDFISKPFCIESLILKVEQFIKIDELNKSLLNKNSELKELVNIKDGQIKQKEEELFRKSKQATMGEMIDYIIHQWRQPINLMKIEIMNFELTHQNIPDASEFSTKMNGKILELNEIISDFRNFFRENSTERFNLEDEVLKVLKIIKSLLIQNSIIIEMESDNSEISFAINDLQHIMFVLINNSIDAFKENNIEPENRRINILIKNKNLIFMDNAGGVKEENRNSLFNYNFTTKSEGTGIGLYMTKQILDKHSSTIEYDSIKNGSSFTLSFNK